MSSMSISASSLSALQQVSSNSTTATRRHHSPIDAVASTLKMSTDDIKTQLQSGKSLSDIAAAQGVSHDDLISALKAGMPDELKNSDDATAMAEKIASTAGLAAPQDVQGTDAASAASATGTTGTSATSGHHHHHRGAASQVSGLDGSSTGVMSGSLTASQQKTLDSLSSLLGTDSSSLLTSLQSGTSLASLVSSKGVDSSKLASVLQDGLLVDTKS